MLLQRSSTLYALCRSSRCLGSVFFPTVRQLTPPTPTPCLPASLQVCAFPWVFSYVQTRHVVCLVFLPPFSLFDFELIRFLFVLLFSAYSSIVRGRGNPSRHKNSMGCEGGRPTGHAH